MEAGKHVSLGTTHTELRWGWWVLMAPPRKEKEGDRLHRASSRTHREGHAGKKLKTALNTTVHRMSQEKHLTQCVCR